MASKAAISHDEPSLGRIRADSVTPPHTPLSIRRRISRVEGKPEIAYAKLFADRLHKTPMKETHISVISGRCPGLTLKQPMALVVDETQDVVSPLPTLDEPQDAVSPRLVADWTPNLVSRLRGYTTKIKATVTYGKLNINIGDPMAHYCCGRLGETMAICESRGDTFH
jgi:hypothetical protein